MLRGKNLACCCALDGEPCHADVLLAVADRAKRWTRHSWRAPVGGRRRSRSLAAAVVAQICLAGRS